MADGDSGSDWGSDGDSGAPSPVPEAAPVVSAGKVAARDNPLQALIMKRKAKDEEHQAKLKKLLGESLWSAARLPTPSVADKCSASRPARPTRLQRGRAAHPCRTEHSGWLTDGAVVRPPSFGQGGGGGMPLATASLFRTSRQIAAEELTSAVSLPGVRLACGDAPGQPPVAFVVHSATAVACLAPVLVGLRAAALALGTSQAGATRRRARLLHIPYQSWRCAHGPPAWQPGHRCNPPAFECGPCGSSLRVCPAAPSPQPCARATCVKRNQRCEGGVHPPPPSPLSPPPKRVCCLLSPLSD